MSNSQNHLKVYQSLRRPDELFEEVEALAGIGYWEWDEINDNCTYCSEQLAAMHGVSVEEFMHRATCMDADLEWVHPDDQEYYRKTTRQLRATKDIVELEYRIVKTGGGVINVRERGVAVVGDGGVHLRSYGFIQDITSLKSAETALRDLQRQQEDLLDQRSRALKLSEQRYAFAITGADLGVWEWDMETEHNYLSGQWKEKLGYQPEDLPDGPGLFARIIHPEDVTKVEEVFRDHLKHRTPFDVPMRMQRKEGDFIWVQAKGHAVWNRNGRATKMGGTVSDITEYRNLLESARYHAERDQLTGLYNRHYFMRIADEILDGQQAEKTSRGIAVLDLDGFKEINDCHGHAAGDCALVAISERLVRLVGQSATVIRLGGDEFAIVFCRSCPWADTQALFEAVLEEVAKPIAWKGFIFECSVSVGIAAKEPAAATTADDLLQQADLAVYDAKAMGGNAVRFYSDDLLTAALNRTNVLSSARQALSDDRFVLCYQPQVDLKTHRLAGFEALLRLRGEDGSLALPGEYPEVFEDSVLACRIGEMVRREAIRQAAIWQRDGFEFGHIAVNISAPEFQAYQRDLRFVEEFLEAIEAAGIAPSQIHVEVTEDVLLTSRRNTISEMLQHLRKSGIKVALDDFGTGHASLIHLKEAEFDHIKIDTSFTQSMLTSDVDLSIVETVCTLASKLNKDVIAEGIETVEQLAALQTLGATYGQGFLIGAAQPAESVQDTLERMPFFRPGRGASVFDSGSTAI